MGLLNLKTPPAVVAQKEVPMPAKPKPKRPQEHGKDLARANRMLKGRGL